MRPMLMMLLLTTCAWAQESAGPPAPPPDFTDAEARLLVSTRICHLQGWRAATLEDIAKEKKYAKIGGVLDKGKIAALQTRLRLLDDQTEEDRRSMDRNKLGKPLGCTDKPVALLRSCVEQSFPPKACRDLPRLAEMLGTVTVHDERIAAGRSHF